MDQHQFMNLDYQLNLDSSFGPNTPRPRSSSNSAPPSGSGRNLVMPPGIMSLSMPAHLGSQSHGASPAPGPSGGHPLMPAISGNRIVSRNLNGTFALTTQPSNDSELQLFRVLQRSNLLGYYDTFISQGGDDVQQLCEAGEEEFLEIMALVGMAAKPLHVRRLQKALQEWMQNPAIFQTPLLPGLATGPCNTLLNRNPPSSQPSTAASTRQNSPGSLQVSHSPSPNLQKETSIPSPSLQSMNDGCYGNPGSPLQLTPVLVESQIQRLSDAAEQLVRTLPPFEPKPQNSKKKICKDLEYVMSMAEDDSRRMDEIRKYAAIYGRFDCKRKPEKPLTLHEVSVNEAAAQICKHIPALLTRRDELFPLARQVVRDSGYQYSKGQSSTGFPDPGFRPHSMGGKGYLDGNSEDGMGPLKKPKLEYPDGYTEQQHRDKDRQRRQGRLEEIAEELRNLGDKGEEMKGAAVNLRNMHDYGSLHRLHQQMENLQNKQAQLMMEQSDILKIQGRIAKGRHMSNISENDKLDTDETDSQYSNSSQSSPRFEMSESSREGDPQATSQKDSSNKGSQKANSKIPKMLLQETLMDEGLRVVKEIVANQHKDSSALAPNQLTYYNDLLPYNKIIASSGGSVIAVANPALCMSSALHCNTTTPPPQPSLSGLVPSDRSKTPNSMSALVNLSQTLGGGASSSVKQEPVSPSTKQD